MGFTPFFYGLETKMVYDNGNVYDVAVLDITDAQIAEKFGAGLKNIAPSPLAANYPTLAAVPHSIINGYKNILAISVGTDYTFPLADKVGVPRQPRRVCPRGLVAAAVAAAAPRPRRPSPSPRRRRRRPWTSTSSIKARAGFGRSCERIRIMRSLRRCDGEFENASKKPTPGSLASPPGTRRALVAPKTRTVPARHRLTVLMYLPHRTWMACMRTQKTVSHTTGHHLPSYVTSYLSST